MSDDERTDRDCLHPRTDNRNQAARPQERKVPVMKGCKGRNAMRPERLGR